MPRLSEAVKLFECTKCRHRSARSAPLSPTHQHRPPQARHSLPPLIPSPVPPPPPAHRFSQQVDLETNDIPPLPEECPAALGCPGTKFTPVTDGTEALLWDYQEIRVSVAPQASASRLFRPVARAPLRAL